MKGCGSPGCRRAEVRSGSGAAVAGKRMAQPVTPQLRKYPVRSELTLRAKPGHRALKAAYGGARYSIFCVLERASGCAVRTLAQQSGIVGWFTISRGIQV
jgi:hypothetical protein